jgi:YHS domain-containing protein
VTDLGLTSAVVDADTISVGYSCPCGCTPAVTYRRGGHAATEGCCCGNEFAVGTDAQRQIQPGEGFSFQMAFVTAPWREKLPVVWAIGPSTHPETDHHHGESLDAPRKLGTALDPVCGMAVVLAAALTKDLRATHLGIDYYFCGRGCTLDFIEDPGRFLDPTYVPSM